MNEPLSMRDLMDQAVAQRDTSIRQLASLAQNAGFKITYTTLHQIRNGTYKSVPSEVTLRAIAWLAGVDASVAFTAAGQPVPGPPFAEELPPGVDNLSLKSRKAALDMLRVLVDLEKDADHAGNAQDQAKPTPMPVDPATGRAFRRGSVAYELHRNGFEAEEPGERSDPGSGQKIGPNVRQLRTADHDDNNIPLPEDYLDLAAHPATDSSGRREHDAGRERGEESQDSDN